MSQIIDQYTDLKNPGAFSGISGFQKNNKDLKKSEIKKALFKSKIYTQHILPKKKLKRRKYLIPHIDHSWQADLLDLQKIKYQNKHFKYLLTVIDCFSKKAWVEPIKFKRAHDTFEAFKKIIETSNRVPLNLHIDGGNEFKGECKNYLLSKKINVFITESKVKASIIERFNRTIKEKMWRLFTSNNNKKYINFLDDLVTNYNNTYHTTIKTTPNSVNKSNENKIFKNIYGYYLEDGPKTIISFKYKVGDYVRCVIPKHLFEKGYTINWSDELFIINKQQATVPPTYKIITLQGDPITKTFYEEELNLVLLNEFSFDTYKILQEKGKKLLVAKLNSVDLDPFWVEKDKFLQ